MAEVVYGLCFAMSVVCAGLLIRNQRRHKSRLLTWSSLCFVGLALSNLLLVIDLVVVPDIDLSLARQGTALVAMVLLIIGLTWEER